MGCLNCFHKGVCSLYLKRIISSRSLDDPCIDYINQDNVTTKRGIWIEEEHESYLVHPMKYDENGEPILQKYTVLKCSECGREENKKEPFCHCGAKMNLIKEEVNK